MFPIEKRINCGKKGGDRRGILLETTRMRVVDGGKTVLIFGREDRTYGKEG